MADPRRERRGNAIAYAIAAVVLVSLAVLAYRPAIVLGVDGDALARSMGGDGGPSTCREVADDRWRCQLLMGSDGLTIAARTTWLGCWRLVGRDAGVRTEGGERVDDSGCINLLDVVSPL